MCTTCGCLDHGDRHETHRGDDHDHHSHQPPAGDGQRTPRVLRLETAMLEKNDRLARENRRWLHERRITALNLLGAPGAGKTALLERTIPELGGDIPIFVIEGDQATDYDADRIRAVGARVVQINTGAGCHLDAAMVSRALGELDPPAESLVVIENVGNLVCPALFDLGERAKVVVFSATDGDDKPLKYPHIVRASEVMVVTKIDLLAHVRFDVAHCIAQARTVNPGIDVFDLSATRGDGLPSWYAWLRLVTRSRAAIH